MNKKILIITPFFAPETHAAVFRAHKLVKYLKRLGWEPYVLTVNINYSYKEDPSLSEELDGVPIYRSRYVEPSLRGFKMALGGQDRTSKGTEIKQGSSTNPKKEVLQKQKNSFFSKIYHYLLKNLLQNPDRFWTWRKPSIRLAKKLIDQENIGLIYTTCLPFTTNQIGIALKKSRDIKWVADFRDPITYAKRMYSDNYRIFIKQKKIQDQTFKYADSIVGLSSSYRLIFHDQYEGKYNDKFTFIPTGLDNDYIPKKAKVKKNTLLFIGEYLHEYKDHFFQLFHKVITDLNSNEIPQILIIGRKEINQKITAGFIKNLNLGSYVTYLDHMPQKELYEYIEEAKYVLLLSGNSSLWWTNFAKLVDYIALQKTVIAMVPEICEARSELTKANLGIFLKNNNDDAVKLRQLILSDNSKSDANTSYCNRYLASSQVKSFIQLFENL